jgi:light-harvesting complex 1 beta chain
MADGKGPSGLTEAEAKEVHDLLIKGWAFSVFASMGAHVLVWLWRPFAFGGQQIADWRFF